MIGGAVIAVLLVAAAFGGMLVSWRARTMREGGVTVPQPPVDPGAALASADGMYLATTPVGQPLERVVAGGLGMRGRAGVSVTETGVLLERRGNRPIFIDRAHLLGIGSATWTLDRAVERDGLTVLRWRLGDGDDARALESTFRLDPVDRPALAAAVATLVPNPEVPDADH